MRVQFAGAIAGALLLGATTVQAQGTAAGTAPVRPGVPVSTSGGGEPLWEVGIGGGAGWLPDYPAAEQGSVRALALPFIRYRGEFLRSDDKGLLRGRFFTSPDLEVDISLKGSFPTRAEDNRARAGMPDLDWLGEVGPRVEWTIARAAHDIARIQLDLPLRTVWSTNFSNRFDYRGLVLQPQLSYSHNDFLKSGVRVKLGVSPIFGSERLMDMFYGVDARHATATRPQYDAKPGYMGSQLALTAVRPLTPWVTLVGRTEARFHHGAANSASPLFRRETNYAAGLALTFTLAKSRTNVPRDPN